MNNIGIDVADRASAMCVVDEHGEQLGHCERWTQEAALAEELGRWPVSRVIIESSPLAEWVATIDDPRRFHRAEAVPDYVGLSPSVHQTGESEYRGRITKEGDELLRWHLVEAAHALLNRGPDCALKRWGERLRQRKGAAKAKVAVARKLAMLLYRLWLSGERFDPQRGLAATS